MGTVLRSGALSLGAADEAGSDAAGDPAMNIPWDLIAARG